MRVKRDDDTFWSGYLAAMGVVYHFEGDATATICQELVRNGNSKDLLRVAKAEEDCYLSMLKKTVRSLR